MHINRISFGKTYLGKAPVRNNSTGKKEMLDFVEYDNTEDILKLKKTANTWNSKRSGNFINAILYSMRCFIKNNSESEKFYGIENKKEEVQAVCRIRTVDINNRKKDKLADKKQEIMYFEVSPDNAYNSPKREYSKLGTSLFGELVKLAKKDKIKSIHLIDTSRGFWENMPYIQQARRPETGLAIYNKNYNKCLKALNQMI